MGCCPCTHELLSHITNSLETACRLPTLMIKIPTSNYDIPALLSSMPYFQNLKFSSGCPGIDITLHLNLCWMHQCLMYTVTRNQDMIKAEVMWLPKSKLVMHFDVDLSRLLVLMIWWLFTRSLYSLSSVTANVVELSLQILVRVFCNNPIIQGFFEVDHWLKVL